MTDIDQKKNLSSTQQQSLGDVQVQGNDNIFNAIQAKVVTLTQNKIIQVSVDEIKTRPFIVTSPYKGLRSFEPEDKDQFFGRDQFIAGLIDELEQTNLILLLGASGSGKSSVVRAGVVPWLCQQWGTRLVNLTLTPDQDPFDSLYASLLSRFKQSEAQAARLGQANTLSQVVKQLKQPDSVWFIFIDQFEELFTISDPDKRDRFITSLVTLCQDYAADPTLKVVATMRADFLDRLDAEPANRLARLTEKHRPLMTQMHPDELRLAIEQPAAHHGVVFEQGLVETIIKDVQGQAGYLPLLQYTLDQLWDSEVRDGGIHDRTLNVQSYCLLGGVRGALQKRVSQIYRGLSDPEQQAAQRIFLKLVGIGGDRATDSDWKPVRKREMRSRFMDPLEQAVLVQLIDANLLVSDAPAANSASEATVEIAHEVLLTSWDELRGWIEQNREAIALRNRINEDASRWKEEKLDDELWSGIKLALAIDLKNEPTFNQVLGGFSPDVIQFVEASKEIRDRREREKVVRRRRTMFGLVSFSVVALALAGTALYQLQQAQRQRVEQLAATAEALLDTQPVEATMHAIAAYGLSRSPLVQFPGRPQFDLVRNSLINAQRSVSEKQRYLQDADAYSLALSPDGNVIVSGSEDGTLQLWDPETGKPQGPPLTGHEGGIMTVAFSPDGSTIASGGIDRTVRLWNTRSGEVKRVLTGHEDEIMAIAFSPDGSAIASGGWNGKVWLFDAKTGEPKGRPLAHDGTVYSLAFSPDNSTLVSGSADGMVRLWDPKTGDLKDTLTKHEGQVYSVGFSPNGNILATAGEDGMVRLWDARSRELKHAPIEHEGKAVYTIAFNRAGTILASGSTDKTIGLWNVNTGTSLGDSLTGHEAAVKSLVFGPDDSTIFSAGFDKTIRLWDIRTETPLAGHEALVSAVAYSPDGKTIASSSWDSTVRLWDVQTKALKHTLTGHDNQVNSVAFSPDGDTVVSGSGDSTVRLWDAETGKVEQVLPEHAGMVMSVAFSSDSSTIVSGSGDTTVRLWNAETGALKQTLGGHEDMVLAVAISPDGSTIASGSEDQTVRLWNAQSGELKHILTEHKDEIRTVAFSPDGDRVVSGSKDGTIQLWSTRTGSIEGELPNSSLEVVESILFSSDGKTIIGSNAGGAVMMWDAQALTPIGAPLTGHSGSVTSVALSPDGNTVASSGQDATIRFWNFAPTKSLDLSCHQLQHHSILLEPATTVAEEARATCHREIWSGQ